MNERIKLLAEQATVNIGDEFHPIDFFHKEKFAELIVRECANEVIDMADKYATFNGNHRRHIVHGAISEKLKEHFGVE